MAARGLEPSVGTATIPSPTVPPPTPDHARWFTEEVQPHAAALRSYLRGAFPTVRDVDDVVQESCLRVWRTRLAQPIQSARGFLFKVARHLALDVVRRDAVSPVHAVRDLAALPVVEDRPGLAVALSKREKIQLLAAAIDALPSRCRAVVVLRKLECLPQKQVAARLGIAEKTVEAQLANAERRCAEFLRRRGVQGYFTDEGR